MNGLLRHGGFLDTIWNAIIPLIIFIVLVSSTKSICDWMQRKTGWSDKTVMIVYLGAFLILCLLGPWEILGGLLLAVALIGVCIWKFGFPGLFLPGGILLTAMIGDSLFHLGLERMLMRAFTWPLETLRSTVFGLFR